MIETPNTIAKQLGKAVHPDALARLLEIWPNAYARVEHRRPVMVPKKKDGTINGAVHRLPMPVRSTPVNDYQRRLWAERYGVPLVFEPKGGFTTVVLRPGPGAVIAARGMAECAVVDAFCRRRGIEVAFRRALQVVTTAAAVREQAAVAIEGGA